MTKVTSSNENKSKSDIFRWDIFKSETISFFIEKCYSISMTFIFDTFQFHCKSESKQVKSNEMQHDMCKSDSIFL